jgi:hypothetical protein
LHSVSCKTEFSELANIIDQVGEILYEIPYSNVLFFAQFFGEFGLVYKFPHLILFGRNKVVLVYGIVSIISWE